MNEHVVEGPGQQSQPIYRFLVKYHFFVCNQQYLFLFGNDMCLVAPSHKGQPIYRFLVKYHLFLFANGSTQTAVNNTKLATWHTAYHTRSITNIKLYLIFNIKSLKITYFIFT